MTFFQSYFNVLSVADLLKQPHPVNVIRLIDLIFVPCASSELEWRLSESGAVKTELEENPRKEIEDKLMSSIRSSLPSRKDSDSEDEDC